MSTRETVTVGTHWGNYRVTTSGDHIESVRAPEYDPNPSAIGQSLLDNQCRGSRIARPMVRAGYLKHGINSERSGRGNEPFVAVSWEEALDLAAQALVQTIADHGNESIYGGSYGWSSAGRFHHAQSQVHRFLKLIGGYTDSVYTYSAAACEAMMPHVLGTELYTMAAQSPVWEDVVRENSLVVAFGGMRLDNSQVNPGGVGAHLDLHWQTAAAEAGLEVVSISPIRDDTNRILKADWLPVVPNTDAALMLGIAHTLFVEDRHDKAFLSSHCTGFEKFLPYLLGETDGEPKTAEWASRICRIPAADIVELARRMASRRVMIALTFSIQRAEHGEQPYWMAAVLAAMLGQIGLPGAGLSMGHATNHAISYLGRRLPPLKWGRVEQGVNPVQTSIPVSRVADMLLNPGQEYDFEGRRQTYPDIRLVYWAGGNPFHHHQDLNRFCRAWERPDTIIVNESSWTATARRADIVFPVKTMMERDDIVCGYDHFITPSRQAVPPYGECRSDYQVFTGLAERFGIAAEFTENRSEADWIRDIYETSVQRAAEVGITLPDFESFWAGEAINLRDQFFDLETMFEQFHADPLANPLATPSGKIEIFSETVDSFGYEDCPGHAVWLEKEEYLGSPLAEQFPLHLLSNQPRTRLHSQLDFGRTSTDSKVRGREPARMNPNDAAIRGISAGDIVRLFNARGACLAGIELSEEIMPGVIQLSTGAWFDPVRVDGSSLECHGNPNTLTRDKASSKLGQALSAHSCLVEVERYSGQLPDVTVHTAPDIVAADSLDIQ